MILGRHRESDEAIQNHLDCFRTQDALNAAMRESPELRERFSAASDFHLRSPYLRQSHRIPRGRVEHEASPEFLATMLARIQAHPPPRRTLQARLRPRHSPGKSCSLRCLSERSAGDERHYRPRSLDDLDALPAADCVYCFIVLQHNPPPVQKQLLRRLFARTRPGGVVLFQIPTDMKDYVFEAASYLSSPPPEMEMHCLPRPVVLAEMHAAGLDLVADDCLGEYGFSIFFGIRPEPAIDAG